MLCLAARHFQADEHLAPRIYKYPCYITRFELCFLQPWWKSITAQSLSEYHCRSEMTLSNGCQIFPCIRVSIHSFCPQSSHSARRAYPTEISSLNFCSEEPRSTAGIQQSFPKHKPFTTLPLKQAILTLLRVVVQKGMWLFCCCCLVFFTLTYSSHN